MTGKQEEKSDKAVSKLEDPTPSAVALQKIGPAPEGASDDELNDHAARYQAEKRKVRWG